MNVDPKTGQIVLNPAAPPVEPKPMNVTSSAITAAATRVGDNTVTQSKAINAIGGKIGGRRKRRGGGEIEVKNIPVVPSAGGSNPSQTLANMMKLKADMAEQSKYDGLGDAPPRIVGGKRTRRKHNARRIGRHTRKNRGTTRKSRSVRSSRSRVRTHRR